ncbi:sulfurtransferase TusA family protein [Kitasatospora sp. RG8]|uniref:sulfurtransferase TusA family protein n=1 Tax=Kitasatospora sp. RG8 TaxID=2820815 RepID=UPI001AE0738F|nr:sulfurtransferase TusA family protein [Kitasatospora sp. RG8]MBP0455600.1 sulfurtransferase TusA family protein [Kitasatospora sp. RG8]
MSAAPPRADLVVDGTGLLCVQLLLRLRTHIADAPAGTVVHIVTTDPAAPLDLPAWCHLTGHHYLGPVPAHQGHPAAPGAPGAPEEPGNQGDHGDSGHTEAEVYALRLAAAATPTRPDRPWHPQAR